MLFYQFLVYIVYVYKKFGGITKISIKNLNNMTVETQLFRYICMCFEINKFDRNSMSLQWIGSDLKTYKQLVGMKSILDS